jgi:hypothetical protein
MGILEDPAMWRSTIGLIIAFGMLVAPLLATAQPPGKVYRIGYLATIPPPAHLWEALLDGLRERGYREGQNLVFERRFSEGAQSALRADSKRGSSGSFSTVPYQD